MVHRRPCPVAHPAAPPNHMAEHPLLRVCGCCSRFHVRGHPAIIRRMRTRGWPYPFRQQPWVEIDVFLADMAHRYAEFRHMSDIVKSVLASDQTEALAACTSMHDL